MFLTLPIRFPFSSPPPYVELRTDTLKQLNNYSLSFSTEELCQTIGLVKSDNNNFIDS